MKVETAACLQGSGRELGGRAVLVVLGVLVGLGAFAPAVRADATIEARMQAALQYAIDNPSPDPVTTPAWAGQYAYALLFMNQQVAYANQLIHDWYVAFPIEKDNIHPYHDTSPQVFASIYLRPQCYALLTQQSRDEIEDMAYRWLYKHSVIDPSAGNFNNASKTVWYITSSENHESTKTTKLPASSRK